VQLFSWFFGIHITSNGSSLLLALSISNESFTDMMFQSLTEPTGRSHAKFWEEVFTIECIKSHVKKIVVHEYRGDQSELEFLQFIVASAHELRTLSVLISKNTFTNLANAAEMTSILGTLSGVPWRRDCKMTVLGPEFQNEQSILKASDPTVDDPFDW
jgi:hypothetical protein